MSDEGFLRDVSLGVGSLLVFVSVVLGTLLGYQLAGGIALVVGAALLVTGATGTGLDDWLPAS